MWKQRNVDDPDELWLIQEEHMELTETDDEVKEAYQELIAAILAGKPLHASNFDGLGEDYDECNV